MNKAELTQKVHAELEKEKHELTKADVKRVVDKTFNLMKKAIESHEGVTINGLVTFQRRIVKAKTYQVPGTKRKVKKQEREVARASISRLLAKKSTKSTKKK